MGRDSIRLAYCGSIAGIGPKNSCVDTGVLFIGWCYQNRILVIMYAVLSHSIHHLLEVWDDAFYITSGQCLLAEASKDVPQPVTKALRKGQPYITGQFSLLLIFLICEMMFYNFLDCWWTAKLTATATVATICCFSCLGPPSYWLYCLHVGKWSVISEHVPPGDLLGYAS